MVEKRAVFEVGIKLITISGEIASTILTGYHVTSRRIVAAVVYF